MAAVADWWGLERALQSLGAAPQLTYERIRCLRLALDGGERTAAKQIASTFADLEISEVISELIRELGKAAAIVATSTAAGAAIGALAGGIGAAPGAAIGMEAGLVVLAAMGLAAIVEFMTDGLPAVGRSYWEGVTGALGAPTRGGIPPMVTVDHLKVAVASNDIARGHLLLVTLLLAGIVAYVTRGRGTMQGLAAQMRNTKLAQWMLKHEAKLLNHPKLRPRNNAAPAQTPKPVEHVAPKAAPKPAKLEPGSMAHKAERWERYKARNGSWDYARWSKQYDTNMRNYKMSAREQIYQDAIGGTQGTLKTPYTNRQIDILKEDEMYAGQLKTGPVSLTKDNIIAIRKDEWLVNQAWNVEHILEQGASKPYLEALEKAGIQAVIGPQH